MQLFSNTNSITAKYCVNELLLKHGGSDVERLGNTLYNSKIELTPHQIKAALFAFKSPLDKGVILADEVGLGKTIEAGIVITQMKYESNAHTLIIAPASLMRQWGNELEEKFGLSSIVMDRKQYSSLKKNGVMNPFNYAVDVIICSYQMCGSFRVDIQKADIDLVVIDEAHKLRNVHNEKSVTANNVKEAIANRKKILLTATPIQNNMMDLYGLASVIDENIFGDKASFKHSYIKNFYEHEDELRIRLEQVLHRTLRQQVSHYINFTNRIPKTFSFEETEEEQEIYNLVRGIIQNADEETYLIPAQQKHLVVLILCKLLGSSSAAIVSTLSTMKARLEKIRQEGVFEEVLLVDYDEDEIMDDDIEDIPKPKIEIDLVKLEAEIAELDNIIYKAQRIQKDSKYYALVDALTYSFKYLKELEAEEKVIIFTESRKTQQYLYETLKQDGYSDIFLYNGTNNDDVSRKIYNMWMEKHKDSDVSKNGKAINMREAILEEFRDKGKILIATEAGAEGLNLQFCSFVINYDLPWNPQKVEQRIGRCHRLGQKHDVVVINFISKQNVVEQRIYELLNNKFRIFDEILGTSDSIIGSLDDGKDLENAILEIYQSCRSEAEINKAFEELQEKYKEEIDELMKKTRRDLLDNFEEDIQDLFKSVMGEVGDSISNIERLLWTLTKAVLMNATYNDVNHSFVLQDKKYIMSHNEVPGYIRYGLNTHLGQKIIEYAASIEREYGSITFDISHYDYKIAKIEELKGKKGYITLNKLIVDSLEKEEYLLFNGILDDGTRIDQEICRKMFRLAASEAECDIKMNLLMDALRQDASVNVENCVNVSQERNNTLIADKINQINAWADDLIESTQLRVEEMRAQRKELQKQSDTAVNMLEKERIESEIVSISKKIKMSWLKLAEDEEEIEEKRKKMIEDIRKESMKRTEIQHIFTVKFEVI